MNRKAQIQPRLMISRACAGQFELALKDAAELANSKSHANVYGCACVYALAHAKTRDDKQAARAVELLRQAVAKGFHDAAILKKDPDLNSLRERDDFKKLLAELDAKLKESDPKP